MSFRIGFTAESLREKPEELASVPQAAPKKSLVRVLFPGRGMALTYYNDAFDLREGDLVYVDGTLEGVRGRVTEVKYSFKVRAADYKRVVAVAETGVRGRFYMAGSHFVTFDREALPREKVLSWFKAPEPDGEYLVGNDGGTFPLDHPGEGRFSPAVAERGHDYYAESKVRYLSVDGGRGYAIVEGQRAYEVEFTYRNGEISGLSCTCPCGFDCKHAFAALLQLRETLAFIRELRGSYDESGYFAAIRMATLFACAVDGKTVGSIDF